VRHTRGDRSPPARAAARYYTQSSTIIRYHSAIGLEAGVYQPIASIRQAQHPRSYQILKAGLRIRLRILVLARQTELYYITLYTFIIFLIEQVLVITYRH
jgi:hypothetical protein